VDAVLLFLLFLVELSDDVSASVVGVGDSAADKAGFSADEDLVGEDDGGQAFEGTRVALSALLEGVEEAFRGGGAVGGSVEADVLGVNDDRGLQIAVAGNLRRW